MRSGTHKMRSTIPRQNWISMFPRSGFDYNGPFSGYNHWYSNKPPMMSSRILDTSTTTVSSLNTMLWRYYTRLTYCLYPLFEIDSCSSLRLLRRRIRETYRPTQSQPWGGFNSPQSFFPVCVNGVNDRNELAEASEENVHLRGVRSDSATLARPLGAKKITILVHSRTAEVLWVNMSIWRKKFLFVFCCFAAFTTFSSTLAFTFKLHASASWLTAQPAI